MPLNILMQAKIVSIIFLVGFIIPLGMACREDTSAKDREIRELNLELEASRLEQAEKQNEIDRMIAEIAEIETKLEETNQKIEFLDHSGIENIEQLEQLQSDREKLLAELDEKSAALNQVQSELLDQSHLMKQLQEELALTEKKINEQTQTIKNLETQIANSNAHDPGWAWLQKELEQAKAKLAESEANLSKIESSLLAVEYMSVQVFLENLGPERLFALDERDLRRIYQYPNDLECLFLFSIDRRVEVLHNDPGRFIPNVSGFEVIPLSIGYHKVAICGPKQPIDFRPMQIHHEVGKIFKVKPDSNRNQRSLLTARMTSSCDEQNSDVIDKNIFGRRYQIIYPYHGDVDGIETIAILRPNNRSIDYTMGSAVLSVRSPSCEQVLQRRHPSSLSHAACLLIEQGLQQSNFLRMGCHTESGSNNGGIDLSFYPKKDSDND